MNSNNRISKSEDLKEKRVRASPDCSNIEPQCHLITVAPDLLSGLVGIIRRKSLHKGSLFFHQQAQVINTDNP